MSMNTSAGNTKQGDYFHAKREFVYGYLGVPD